ncbi:uncharacterized protein [Malus domestica]|uniref:uncharacterized protein n=1 Tax=Malus domestica TaxID=3750 RepID=UPI003977178F
MIDHVMRFCPRAMVVWFSSPLGIRNQGDRRQSLMEWIAAIAGLMSSESFDLVMVLIWCIWTERNAMLWNGKALELLEMHCKLQTWLHEFHKWHGPRKNTNVVTGQPRKCPENEWIQSNFDAAWDAQLEIGGVGVVIRNNKGEFMVIVAMRVEGVGSPLLVEIMAAREALIFSQHQQTTHVEVEGDALMVSTTLQHEGLNDSSPFGHIITNIRQILNDFSQCKVTFGRRSTNKVVHRLARLGLTLDTPVAWFEEPHDVII